MGLFGGVQGPRRRSREKAVMLTMVLVWGLYMVVFGGAGGGETGKGESERGRRRAWGPWRPQATVGATPASASASSSSSSSSLQHPLSKALVVASTRKDDTSWLFSQLPDWRKSIYVVDDRNAELTVPLNKGRESMAYLTYIIDNYDRLPDVILFIHSQRYQWHNDDPYYDGVPMIQRVQIPYLQRQGYANLRCAWILGCPIEIRPHTAPHREDVHAGEYFKTGFMELFPDAEVPEEVGVSCCAQFGTTRWKILERPRSDYIRFRKWLAETELADELSGRIMEYSWHMILGQSSVYCPTAEDCYCNVFGLCGLSCPDDGRCDERYVLPPYSNLPAGWPYLGWNGQKQDPSTGLPEPFHRRQG